MSQKLQILLVILLFSSVHTLECPARSVRGFPGFHTAPCYLYERFETQFVTAERMCRLSGGHLASISDGFVNAFVAHGGNEAFLIMEVEDFWLGGENLEDQQKWEWVDGQKWDYTRWDKDQPNNETLNRCTAMKLIDGKWTSKNCFDRKPYICALDYVRNDTTSFPSTQKWFTTASPLKTETWMTTLEQLSTSLSTKLPIESTVQSTQEPSTEKLLTSTVQISTQKPTTEKLLTTIQSSTQKPTTEKLLTTIQSSTQQQISTVQTSSQKSTTEKLLTTIQTSTELPSTLITTELPSTVQTSTEFPTSTIQTSTTLLTSTELPSTSTSTSLPTTTEEVELIPGCIDSDWLYIYEDGADEQCYNVYKSSGWESDRELCNSLGASLVSIHSYPKYLKALIYNTLGTEGRVDVTIGLKESNSSGIREWAWVDETPYDYTNWLTNPTPVKDDDPFRCAVYNTDTLSYDSKFGKWKVVDCDNVQARVVCQQEPIYIPEFIAVSLKNKKKAKKLNPRKH